MRSPHISETHCTPRHFNHPLYRSLADDEWRR